MPGEEGPKMIDIEDFTVTTELTILMLPRRPDAKTVGNTVFKILRAGKVPEVDCTRTEEGFTLGPAMLFLGSVAIITTVEDIKSDPESTLICGKIAGNHRLVLGDIITKAPFVIPGVVDPSLQIITRRRR